MSVAMGFIKKSAHSPIVIAMIAIIAIIDRNGFTQLGRKLSSLSFVLIDPPCSSFFQKDESTGEDPDDPNKISSLAMFITLFSE